MRWRKQSPRKSTSYVHRTASSYNCGLIQSILSKQRLDHTETENTELTLTPLDIERGYSSSALSPMKRLYFPNRSKKQEAPDASPFSLLPRADTAPRNVIPARVKFLSLEKHSSEPVPKSIILDKRVSANRRHAILQRPSSMKQTISRTLEDYEWGNPIP